MLVNWQICYTIHILLSVHFTCLIEVSSATTATPCGGGGGEVKTTSVSLTTWSEASETANIAQRMKVHRWHCRILTTVCLQRFARSTMLQVS